MTTTFTRATRNLGVLMTEVRAWFAVDSVRLADTPLKQIINDVIQDLYRRGDFGFLSDTDTSITTTPGDGVYTMPSGVGRVMGVYVTGDGSWWLKYAEPKAFQESYVDDDSTGAPVHFTIWGGELLLGPTPSGSYQINIMHYAYPDELSSSTDANDFLTYAWDVVLFGTLAEVAKYLMESDRIMEFSTEYQKRFNRFLIDQVRGSWAGQRPASIEPGGEI